jgi:hypothetical protein
MGDYWAAYNLSNPADHAHSVIFAAANGLPPPPPLPPPPGPPVPEPPDQGEIRYTDLVPGQRYVINSALPDDGSDYDDLPYEGTYASFENYGSGLYVVKFTGVTNRNGELIHHREVPGNDDFLVDHYRFSILGGPLQPNIPPKPWPQRNIPPNTEDIVNQDTITEGMDMVDFHGEYGFGRYYPLEVYTALQVPKRNPMTRQRIINANLQYYTAHIAPAGGRRRRKTKKSSRRMRKTRRRHK